LSTGDIDNRLGPELELSQLRATNPEFDAYLRVAWQFKPIRTFFVPYGAGCSSDGQRVYISYDVQSNIDGIECESALVRHETTEWALREFLNIGDNYAEDPSGHRLANRAEFDRVNELLRDRVDAWELYSEIIDEQVLNAERQQYSDRPIPQDLAMYPYSPHERAKLQDAMGNDRSWDEWERLVRDQVKPYTMEEVEYTNEGSEAEHCSICDHYVNASSCAIVNGLISPDGWCNKFTAYEVEDA